MIFILAVLSLAACNKGGMEHDAMGTFEATEVIVSAEQAGRLSRTGMSKLSVSACAQFCSGTRRKLW